MIYGLNELIAHTDFRNKVNAVVPNRQLVTSTK